MPLSQQEVIEAFELGEYGRLIGALEGEWLEAKRVAYQLDIEADRFELAKDITGLANADGGLLLLGFATNKDPVHRADRISALTPIPAAHFDEQRFRQFVENLTYPAITNLRINIARVEGDEVLVMVRVEAAGAARPIIVKHVLNVDGHLAETAIAVCERRQAGIKRLTAERIQSLLRDGLRFDEGMRTEFEGIHAQLRELRGNQDQGDVRGPFAHRYPGARELAVQAAGLSELPTMALVCLPRGRVDMRELFEARTAPAVRLLEAPPTIRDQGFPIRPDINSRIVNGEMRRSLGEEHSVLDAYRDGTLLYAVRGDGEGLCWPAIRYPPQINPVFLLEQPYLFLLLVKRLLEPHGVTAVSLKLELHRMFHADNSGRALNQTVAPTLGGHRLPQANIVIDLEWLLENASPERAAFEWVSNLYHRVAVEDDRVPYTRVTAEGRVIDTDAIRAL